MGASVKKYLFIIKAGLLTAAAVILFEVINICVAYGYMRTDLYVGLTAVSFLVAGMLIRGGQQRVAPTDQNKNDDPKLLTEREKQVMMLLAQGKSNKEIATTCFIEISTVKTHLNNIYAKLSVKTRKEACALYLQLTKDG